MAAASQKAATLATTTDDTPGQSSSNTSKLQDQASKAALLAANSSDSKSSSTATNPLGPDGKLSSASAATSLKHAKPHELPSFPTVGIDSQSSGGKAASLATTNQKPFEHWKPEMSSSASKAALLAAEGGGKLDLWQPSASETGVSAAGTALGKQKGLSPQLDYGYSAQGASNALKAATMSINHGQKRSVAAEPTPVPQYPDAHNSTFNALNAASVAHTPSIKKKAPAPLGDSDRIGSAAMEAARVQNLHASPAMFGEHPPVSIEVEEKRHADALRASAISFARLMYDAQPKDDDAKAGAGVAAAKQSHRSIGDDELRAQAVNYINLQEEAQRLANERLAKLDPDGVAAYRQHYGYGTEQPKRNKLSIRGSKKDRTSEDADDSSDDDERAGRIRRRQNKLQDDVASVDEKRTKDRADLLATAQKLVQQRMMNMDEKVFQETGKASPAMMEEWETRAKAKAAADSETRMANHGKVHIGGGKYMDQSEIDAIAAGRMQPTLDEIHDTAEKQRARDEEIKQDQQRRKAEEEAEKQREKEEKAEQLRQKNEEKAKTNEEKSKAKAEADEEKRKAEVEKKATKAQVEEQKKKAKAEAEEQKRKAKEEKEAEKQAEKQRKAEEKEKKEQEKRAAKEEAKKSKEEQEAQRKADAEAAKEREAAKKAAEQAERDRIKAEAKAKAERERIEREAQKEVEDEARKREAAAAAAGGATVGAASAIGATTSAAATAPAAPAVAETAHPAADAVNSAQQPVVQDPEPLQGSRVDPADSSVPDPERVKETVPETKPAVADPEPVKTTTPETTAVTATPEPAKAVQTLPETKAEPEPKVESAAKEEPKPVETAPAPKVESIKKSAEDNTSSERPSVEKTDRNRLHKARPSAGSGEHVADRAIPLEREWQAQRLSLEQAKQQGGADSSEISDVFKNDPTGPEKAKGAVASSSSSSTKESKRRSFFNKLVKRSNKTSESDEAAAATPPVAAGITEATTATTTTPTTREDTSDIAKGKTEQLPRAAGAGGDNAGVTPQASTEIARPRDSEASNDNFEEARDRFDDDINNDSNTLTGHPPRASFISIKDDAGGARSASRFQEEL